MNSYELLPGLIQSNPIQIAKIQAAYVCMHMRICGRVSFVWCLLVVERSHGIAFTVEGHTHKAHKPHAEIKQQCCSTLHTN